MHNTLQERQMDLTYARVSDRSFIMVVFEEKYFEAYAHNKYICFINNTTEESQPMLDGSDVHRFSNWKWVLNMCTVRSL